MKLIINKVFILSMAFQLINVDSIAQKLLNYEGPYTLGDSIEGFATYKYINENDNEVKQDEFHFNASKKINEKYYKGITIDGYFKNNLKSDEWVYSEKILHPTGPLYLSNNHFEKSGDGKEHQITGYYSEGQAQKNWNSYIFEIENSQVVDTKFIASAFFKDNYMTSEFTSSSSDFQLKGTVDDNNYFSGKWEFIHHKDNQNNKIKVVREYQEGRLINHYLELNGEQTEIINRGLNEPSDHSSEKEIVINEIYSEIIYHTYSGLGSEIENFSSNDVEELITQTNNFLLESVYSFTKINEINIWELTEGSKQIVLPKVKVNHHPYTSEEKNQLKESLERSNELQDKVKKFIQNPQVNINRYAYKEISIGYQVLKLYKEELQKLEKNIALLSLPSFEYINRDEILPVIFSEISYPSTITYEYKDQKEEFSPNFPDDLIKDQISIQKIYQHVISIENQIKKEFNKIDPILEKINQKEAISDKEQIMVNKKDSVLMLFDNENSRQNDYHKRYRSEVISYIEKYFKDYAEKPIESRMTEIDEAIKCMDDFINLYKVLDQLPKKTERIKEIYTRVVWNPFTFTDMEEIVKERVFNAYQNYVLEYLLDNLSKNLNCENVKSASNNFNILFKRMKEIRDEDTSEQEKALKRNTDVKNIVEILEIPLL